MTLEEEVAALRAENQALRKQLAAVLERLVAVEGWSGTSRDPKANMPTPEGPRVPRHEHSQERSVTDRRDELYDLHLGPPPLVTPLLSADERRLLDEALQQPAGRSNFPFHAPRTIYLARTLPETRRFLKALRDAGGGAVIVPVRYREPRITRDAARTLAQQQAQDLRARTDRIYGELQDATDDRLWWSFFVPDIAAQFARMIPGGRFINIDKVDGHAVTSAEIMAWAKLSDPD
jgi:hypothetical protein